MLISRINTLAIGMLQKIFLESAIKNNNIFFVLYNTTVNGFTYHAKWRLNKIRKSSSVSSFMGTVARDFLASYFFMDLLYMGQRFQDQKDFLFFFVGEYINSGCTTAFNCSRHGEIFPSHSSANKVINLMKEDFIVFAAAKSLHTPT
jgi:hypothetical protein